MWKIKWRRSLGVGRENDTDCDGWIIRKWRRGQRLHHLHIKCRLKWEQTIGKVTSNQYTEIETMLEQLLCMYCDIPQCCQLLTLIGEEKIAKVTKWLWWNNPTQVLVHSIAVLFTDTKFLKYTTYMIKSYRLIGWREFNKHSKVQY